MLFTASAGTLITRIDNIAEKYERFVGVNASMNALMHPAMYGTYHHISVIGGKSPPLMERYHVRVCDSENNDQFTAGTARALPEISI